MPSLLEKPIFVSCFFLFFKILNKQANLQLSLHVQKLSVSASGSEAPLIERFGQSQLVKTYLCS